MKKFSVLLAAASLAVAISGCGGHPGRDLTGPRLPEMRIFEIPYSEARISCDHTSAVLGGPSFEHAAVIDSIVVFDVEYTVGDGLSGQAAALELHPGGHPNDKTWVLRPGHTCPVVPDPVAFNGRKRVNFGGVEFVSAGGYELTIWHGSEVSCAGSLPPGINDLSVGRVEVHYHYVE